MMTPEQEELEKAAALVVTSISRRNLADTNGSYSVTVPRRTIERLHAALEAYLPGWVDSLYNELESNERTAQAEREAKLADN